MLHHSIYFPITFPKMGEQPFMQYKVSYGMNRQTTELENYTRQKCKTRESMSGLLEVSTAKDTTKNGLALVPLVRVLLESIQAKYTDTMKREDRRSFLALTDELIVLTDDLR